MPTQRQIVRALKGVQKKLKPLILQVQQEEGEEEVDIGGMVEFLKGINEPLESGPLEDCIEDLRGLDGLTDDLRKNLEAVEEMVDDLVEQIEEEIDADKGDPA